jgi:internalin A
MSERAQHRIRGAKEQRLTSLNLSGCGLTEIPNEVFELTWLEGLTLSGNRALYDLSLLTNLPSLQQLDVQHTRVSDLSPLTNLLSLQQLYVQNTHVSDLSPLTNLTALQRLEVGNTSVSDLNPLRNLTVLQVLDVQSTQVSDLSPLTNLTALQELFINFTQVQDLSPLTNLTALQQLYVNGTQVPDLSPLVNLTALQQLDVSNSQIHDLSPLANLTVLQVLDAQNTQVNDLIPLTNLTALQKFYVNNTQVHDLGPLTNLTALQQLNVYSTQVHDLSPLINLTALQQLNVYSTQVHDLSPLTNLTALKHLNFHSTQVHDLSPLAKLTTLQQLYFSLTQVRDLSPLANLTALIELDISSPEVRDLNPLKDLTNLQVLYIYETQVNDLNPLKDLKALKRFYVYKTQVRDLNPLSQLTALQILNIDSTQVSDLSPLANLIALQKLFVPSTQISDLTPLKDLIQLQVLDIDSTQISDLSPLTGLMRLKQLDIKNTKVTDLTPLESLVNLYHLSASSTQISDLSKLKKIIEKGAIVKWEQSNSWEDRGIYVQDCPLDKSLIAAIKKGNKAVLTYFNKPKERLFEVRVLVLGEPRAGKTTLRRKLKSPTAAMPTTVESTKAFEIEIEPYICVHEKNGEKNKLTYHLWDFGGQDYYRLLHQLFVSEQSVYIIVTDTDRNKNEEEIDFWLETIQRLGKDKKGNYGPVILLQNPKTNREGSDFVDLKKRYRFWQQNEQFVINLNALDEKNTSAYDKKQLERFKRFKAYLEESFCQLDHIGKEMPTQWIDVRKGLAKYEKENWITVEAFNKVCASKKIIDPSEQDDLLGIFHTLGYVLHYKDSALGGMVILNREWVTDALYRVLDDAIVKVNRGWFKKEDAETIWHEARYKNRTPELLALMQEFKLSYYNLVSQKHIVPAKLPEDTEGLPTWTADKSVRLHLQYDWMPRAVPTQLIVSLHNDIVDLEQGEQWIWRKGAVLDGRHLGLKDVQVQIEDNWRSNKIEITAKGANSELLIRTIMRNWREVNQPFEDKVKVSKIILCACEKCQSARTPFEFEYEDVLEAKEANDTLKCNKSRKEFTAADILRGLFDETTQLADLAFAKGTRSELLNLIADGKIDSVLDAFSNDDKLIISLKAQYQHLTIENMRGVLTYDTYRIGVNKIAHALVEYLNANRKDMFGKHERMLFGEPDLERMMDNSMEKHTTSSAPIINIYGGQVNIGQNIAQVAYNPNNGISKEEFDILKAQIEKMSQTHLAAVKTFIEAEPVPNDEAEKAAIGTRIYNWLNKNAEGIVGNVAASVYYDTLKHFLGIG